MKTFYKIIILSCVLILDSVALFAQNNALQLNGGIITLNNGTSATPVYLVVNQNNTLGITRSGSGGHIVSEGNYNYLNWNMGAATGNYVVPFGIGSVAADYIPVSFNKTSASSSNVSFSTYATGSNNLVWAGASSVAAVSNMNVASGNAVTNIIDRWWDIKASAATTADITFRYKGSENTTASPLGAFVAQRWNGFSWDAPTGSGAGVNSGIGTLTINNQTSFSPFVMVGGSTLPIELLSFTGKNQGVANLIEWTTASESNNDYYTLERSPSSASGLAFEPIATIDSKAPNGNSNTILNYHFNDEIETSNFKPQTVFYYRLKQTDFNGNISYAKNIVSLGTTLKTSDFLLTTLYPNPATDRVQLTLNSSQELDLSIDVVNVLGKQVASNTYQIQSGENNINLDLSGLSKGVYFLQLSSANGNKQQKTLIIK